MNTIEVLYTLRPAVNSITTRNGEVTLLAWPRHKPLGVLTDGQRAALRMLADEPCSATDLVRNGSEVAALLDDLRADGWISTTVCCDGKQLYSIQPFDTPAPRDEAGAGPGALSKFTVIRRHRGHLVLENPRSWCYVQVHDARVLSIAGGLALDTPLPAEVAGQIVTDLHWTRCTVPDPAAEEQDFASAHWSAHELWFHHRSRIGRRGWGWEPFGKTQWAKGVFDPLPARRTPYPGDPVPLAVPAIESRRETDPSLTSVIEDRHSCRSFDDTRPMSVDQLAELLYRCARTRHVVEVDGKEAVSKPYPSGGSMYELELYPVVRTVDGLTGGMYHYDSADHVLRPVVDAGHPAVKRLLRAASITLADRQHPQVLIVIAARPGRLMWIYEQMPYSLILKHVGALTQTLYLVATAMGLGGVALGAGESSAFAEATGADDLVECSVGDFVVGAPAAKYETWPYVGRSS